MAWRVAACLLLKLALLAVVQSSNSYRRLLVGAEDAARPTHAFKLLADEQESEQEALLSLKKMFNPDIATAKLASWKPDTYPCDGWQGVYCTSQKRVYFVDLAGQGLSGKLSDAVDLSALAYLQILWLQENSLAGSLPPSMFKGLGRLHELMLFDNELEGPLPAGLSEATQRLKRLYLNGNRLSGSLPDWSGMANLVELGLASNRLEGTVPEAYSNLGKLKEISLHNNPNLVGCLPTAWSTKQPPVRLIEDERHTEDGGGLNPALVFTELCGFCSATCQNPPPPVPSPSPLPPSPSPRPAPPSPSPEPSSSSNSSSNSSSTAAAALPSPSPAPSSSGSNSTDAAGGPTEEKAAAAAGAATAADAAPNTTATADGTAGTENATNSQSTGALPAVGSTTGSVSGPPGSPESMSTFAPSVPKSKVDNPDDLVMTDTTARKSVFMSINPDNGGRKRKKVLM